MEENHTELSEDDRRELDKALLEMIAAGELWTFFDPVRRELVFVSSGKTAGLPTEAN
jgi:hypothetical protein